MNRFLIFLLLFPAVATASFYAVTYILSGAAQDSGLGPVFMYLVFIVPGLLVALLDWLEQILIRRDHNRLRRRSSGTLGQ